MGLKIYFCGSVTGGRQDRLLYNRLIEELKTYGDVLTEAVGAADIEVTAESRMSDKELHDTFVDRLKIADVVVAEVTQTSLGVGYEIGRSIEMKKKILCLFRPSNGKRLSSMIAGADNDDNLKVKYYKQAQEACDIFRDFLGPKYGDSACSS